MQRFFQSFETKILRLRSERWKYLFLKILVVQPSQITSAQAVALSAADRRPCFTNASLITCLVGLLYKQNRPKRLGNDGVALWWSD
jgi:hypothetical protein